MLPKVLGLAFGGLIASIEFTYQELQRESKIQRKRLRDGVDELVLRKMVIRHVFSTKDPNLEHNGIYYLLNWSNPGSKQLVDHYYNNISSKNEKETISNNKDEKPMFKGDLHDVLKQSCASMEKILDSKSSKSYKEKNLRLFLYSLMRLQRGLELRSVKEQIKLEYSEMSDPRSESELVNFFISRGYSFLDSLIKSSADEKLVVGIRRYSTLWEATEKTSFFDKYKSEIN